VGVFDAHYRSSIFLIVLLITVLSMASYPRFCSLDWDLRPKARRYLAYFRVLICLARFLLSYISDVVSFAFFRTRDSAIVTCARGSFRALSITESSTNWSLHVRAQKLLAGSSFRDSCFPFGHGNVYPILGGMLAIAGRMISDEITYGAASKLLQA
jgi:hypothetical protein